MSTKLKYVGLDVHKDTTVVAIADGGRDGEVRVYGSISSDLHAVEKMMAKLRSDGSTLRVVYEAGPTGYVLYRRLLQLKIECIVVAPSRTPHPKGTRQNAARQRGGGRTDGAARSVAEGEEGGCPSARAA